MAQSVYGMEVLEPYDLLIVVWMEDPELYVQHLKARRSCFRALKTI